MPTYGQYDVPTSNIMVNLGVGQPDNRKLPLNLIKDAMKNLLTKRIIPKYYNMEIFQDTNDLEETC